METETYRLTHCRHDHMHCIVPGLFQSHRRGERGSVDLRHEMGHTTVRVVCFQQLGADDLRYLHGLVALAGVEGKLLSASPTHEVPRQLRAALQTTSTDNAIFISGRICNLLHEVGLSDGGANIRAFRESLTRLANVTVYRINTEGEQSFHLLSYIIDNSSAGFTVALNPAIAEAINGGRHTRIELEEVRGLEGDAALILHQRLCGIIAPAGGREFKTTTLCSYIWPEPTTGSAQSKQKKRLRDAVEELQGLGWGIKLPTQEKIWISRPPGNRSNGQLLRSNSQKNRSNGQ